jgi:hypothetical protein
MMQNKDRIKNYLKQHKSDNEESLTFRQKRRIRKNVNKENK